MTDNDLHHVFVTQERFGPVRKAEWLRQRKALDRLKWNGATWEARKKCPDYDQRRGRFVARLRKIMHPDLAEAAPERGG